MAAVAVLLAAMLHNGWFTDLKRRLSELAKNFGQAPERSDDDPPGADGDEVLADAELDDDGEETPLDEGGGYSARQGPERGDI